MQFVICKGKYLDMLPIHEIMDFMLSEVMLGKGKQYMYMCMVFLYIYITDGCS